MESDAVILTHAAPVEMTTPTLDRRRIAWGAVLGGGTVAVAMWMLLQLLGFAVGLTAVDVDRTSSLEAVAIGTGVWGMVAPLIAFFVGGLVAGRATHALTHLGNMVTGVVMWSLTAIGGLLVLGMVISAIVGGTVSAGGKAVGAAGSIAQDAIVGVANGADDAGGIASSMGLRANDALAPVNRRLRAEGKPAITAAQLEAAAKDIVVDGVRAGKLDRAMLVRSIADQTALSDADAEDIATRIQAQYDAARAAVNAKIAEAKRAATEAAQATTDATGKVMLGLFAALVLGLLAAVAGAVLGGRSHDRRHAKAAYAARTER